MPLRLVIPPRTNGPSPWPAAAGALCTLTPALGLSEHAGICTVLRSTCRVLGPDQIIQSQIVGRDGPKPGFDPVLPSRLEPWTTGQLGKQINSDRRNPELNDPPGVCQIFDRVSEVRSPEEVPQRIQCLPRVGWGRIQQNIKIPRSAGTSVKGYGVGADDEIPYPMVVQCGDELFVVSGCHRVLASSGNLRVQQRLLRRVPRASALRTKIENPLRPPAPSVPSKRSRSCPDCQ